MNCVKYSAHTNLETQNLWPPNYALAFKATAEERLKPAKHLPSGTSMTLLVSTKMICESDRLFSNLVRIILPIASRVVRSNGCFERNDIEAVTGPRATN
jgi:hypothetical protein